MAQLQQRYPEAPPKYLYDQVFQQMGKITIDAYRLRGGSTGAEQMRNPAADKFLLNNAQELQIFFPELFRKSLRIEMGRQIPAASQFGSSLSGYLTGVR